MQRKTEARDGKLPLGKLKNGARKRRQKQKNVVMGGTLSNSLKEASFYQQETAEASWNRREKSS